MDATEPNRKGRRCYDASGRQERARRQHDTSLDHARRLFLEDGYAATTVESIARAAGVSPATVYKTYGGKAGLARELCRRALLGSGGVPAQTRSDALHAAGDGRAIAAGWGELATEVSPRVSPLALVLRTAAESDREAAALYAEISEARLRRMCDNARHLAVGGHLRASVTIEAARDVLWVCTSPEFYDLVVVQRGWTLERFGQLVADTIIGSLLGAAS